VTDEMVGLLIVVSGRGVSVDPETVLLSSEDVDVRDTVELGNGVSVGVAVV
jgi:hypothetical protein